MNVIRQLFTRLKPRLMREQRGAIGVNLSLQRLHMVQLRKNIDGQICLHGRVSLDYPGNREELLAAPRELRQLINRGLTAGRFEGRRAVLGMPSDAFRTMPITYRAQSQVPDDQVIARLMTERLDGDINDYVIDYIPVRAPAPDADKLAIVAVSPRVQVLKYLESMRAAGLVVDALEISPIAIRRLINALPSSSSDMILILNTGSSKSYLTMLSGRRLLMDQPIEFCESRLLETLATTLDMTAASAWDMVQRTGIHPHSGAVLAGHRVGETGIFNTLLEILKPEFLRLGEEIDRAFMYAAAQTRGGGDARICLFGSLAHWSGVDQVLADLTHLPISTLPNPLYSFGDDGDITGYSGAMAEPEFAVASGLALKGLIDDD